MYDQIKKIEDLNYNFDNMTQDICFMKEKITNFYFYKKFEINFENCHIAISRNGGLMAICKKKSFLDTQRLSDINSNVVVIQQNAKNYTKIPIDWNYSKRWIVSFDFTENEKLYGICNDGIIYKFDILIKQAKEKLTSKTFTREQIYKAKFIERGFIALTSYGTFYYVKDFKNIVPISIFQMGSLLEFSNNIDFIGIPSSASKSGKLELLFTNENGNGVIHVTEQPEGYNYNIVPNPENGNEITINDVYVLQNNELEPYIKNSNDIINTYVNVTSTSEKEGNSNTIGKIIAMAISPSYEQFALYNSDGIVYIFSSKFDKGRKETKFEEDKDLSETEINEQKAIIHFNNKCQFLFCGEDAIAISGQRFILIVNELKKTLVYKIAEGDEVYALQGGVFSKCISEVDGLRFATNEGIFFISKVSKELLSICAPFSDNPAKKLLKAYKSDLMKEANCDKEIRKIFNELPNSILTLAIASANIFWTNEKEENEEENKKELQLFILKAAQLGKYFMEKDDFNFDRFVEICRSIRIINSLRNDETTPIFITYKEYKEIDDKNKKEELIKIIMGEKNFKLAFRISKYLEYNTKKIFHKWAYCKIKKLEDLSSKESQMKVYEDIIREMNNIKNISYIKLAKKAFKYKQNELGMKFLEQEKSILAKIPQYLNHKKWDKALELCYETFDSDILATALNKISDYNEIDNEFIDKVKNIKNIKFSVIDYLKKNKPEYIRNYLEEQGDYEELMFVELENYFNSNKLDEKKKHIKLAKEYQKKIDKNNINNKFYLTYLKELNISINFKKDCMDIKNNIIKKNYIEPFDNSIYDCYKLGVKENKLNWIEGQNKNYELNPKKMAIMRIRTMAENGKIDMIENMVKESSLKKLNLTPLNLAELYFDYKKYDLAVKYIRQMNNNDFFDYKVEMLLYMEKYEDTLDVVISSKKMEIMPDIINDILNKKPNLQNLVKELCNKYKVNLN